MTYVLNTVPRKAVEVYTAADNGKGSTLDFHIEVRTDGKDEVEAADARVYRADIREYGIYSVMKAIISHVTTQVHNGQSPHIPHNKNKTVSLRFKKVIPTDTGYGLTIAR